MLRLQSTAGVDDLLDNTHRTLGLSLERSEAAALISMLDANGDNCIQCEELEVREYLLHPNPLRRFQNRLFSDLRTGVLTRSVSQTSNSQKFCDWMRLVMFPTVRAQEQ